MSFLVGPLDPVVRLAHVAAVIAWVGLLHFLAFIRPVITQSLGEGTRKEVIPHLAARLVPWLSWSALGTVVLGLVLYLDRILRFSVGTIPWETHLGSLLGLAMLGLTHALVLPGLRQVARLKEGGAPPPAGSERRVLTASRAVAVLSWATLALMVFGSH